MNDFWQWCIFMINILIRKIGVFDVQVLLPVETGIDDSKRSIFGGVKTMEVLWTQEDEVAGGVFNGMLIDLLGKCSIFHPENFCEIMSVEMIGIRPTKGDAFGKIKGLKLMDGRSDGVSGHTGG